LGNARRRLVTMSSDVCWRWRAIHGIGRRGRPSDFSRIGHGLGWLVHVNGRQAVWEGVGLEALETSGRSKCKQIVQSKQIRSWSSFLEVEGEIDVGLKWSQPALASLLGAAEIRRRNDFPCRQPLCPEAQRVELHVTEEA